MTAARWYQQHVGGRSAVMATELWLSAVYTPAPKMNKTIAASSLRESAMHGARRVEPRAHAAARDGLLDGGAQQVGRGQLGLQLRAAPLLRVG